MTTYAAMLNRKLGHKTHLSSSATVEFRTLTALLKENTMKMWKGFRVHMINSHFL